MQVNIVTQIATPKHLDYTSLQQLVPNIEKIKLEAIWNSYLRDMCTKTSVHTTAF
jgi:hypothetical protein